MSKKDVGMAEMSNLPLFLDSTLNPENRWVKLSKLIPWDAVDEIYESNFKSNKGPSHFPSRVALGALIIQVKLNLSDEETVDQIAENPYLQYFIGFSEYQDKVPFDSSLMTHFRKRLNVTDIKQIDELIHMKYQKLKNDSSEDNDDGNDDNSPDPGGSSVEKSDSRIKNKGQLIVDATCAPADIHYPTDLTLLNCAREKTEQIIDILWVNRSNKEYKKKPRANRKKARNSFCRIIKKKRVKHSIMREAIRVQLGNILRNLKSIEKLSKYCKLNVLGSKLYRDLLVIHTLYEQQYEMYKRRKHTVDDRIVSIHQPHVRPIVRGKAGAKTEFGAKISISFVDGWSFIDTISFDAYNEGIELEIQIERYKERFGFYPKSVHADQIYRNKKNIRFCKERNIRLSGPQLGRPPKNQELLEKQKKTEREDEGVRSAVEGRFGVVKRRYGLSRIMTKLKATSETVIALIFMVMNLDVFIHALRIIFCKNIEDTCYYGVNLLQKAFLLQIMNKEQNIFNAAFSKYMSLLSYKIKASVIGF